MFKEKSILLSAVICAGVVFGNAFTEGKEYLCDAMAFNDGWILLDGGTTKNVTLPHCWNIEDGTDGPIGKPEWSHDSVGGKGYLRKKCIYEKKVGPFNAELRQYLRVNAASIHAVVRVDGKEIGRHDGAFTAFTFELPEEVRKKECVITIEVDNFFDANVPPICGDFTMYGGLYRGIELIESSPRREFIAEDGLFRDELRMPKDMPKYEVRDEGFFVDGKKVFLRGVNYHQDRKDKGWAVSREDEEEDIKLIARMGANAIRTSHYVRGRNFYDLCDKYGIYVWTEIPVVDAVTDSEEFRKNLRKVTREMVLQHRHHKCIAMWGIFNEVYLKDMPAGLAEPMMKEVRDIIKELDPANRPVIAATCKEDKRELNAIPDALGFNLYPGWYGNDKASDLSEIIERWRIKNNRKTICVSEYGAGASLEHEMPHEGYKPDPVGNLHPYMYQLRHHEESWRQIVKNGNVWGVFLWLIFDCGSDSRYEGAKYGINDKGLVCFDHRTLKPSYKFYQKIWNELKEKELK